MIDIGMWNHYVFLPGKAKSSVNGEKEGIKIRHGDNEFASGIYWLTIVLGLLIFYFIHLMTCVHV